MFVQLLEVGYIIVGKREQTSRGDPAHRQSKSQCVSKDVHLFIYALQSIVCSAGWFCTAASQQDKVLERETSERGYRGRAAETQSLCWRSTGSDFWPTSGTELICMMKLLCKWHRWQEWVLLTIRLCDFRRRRARGGPQHHHLLEQLLFYMWPHLHHCRYSLVWLYSECRRSWGRSIIYFTGSGCNCIWYFKTQKLTNNLKMAGKLSIKPIWLSVTGFQMWICLSRSRKMLVRHLKEEETQHEGQSKFSINHRLLN